MTTTGAVPALVLATDGANGALVLRSGARVASVHLSDPVAVVDTTGAGDSFAAGVLAVLDPAHCSDVELRAAILLGHRAAGVMIGRLGAQPGIEGRQLLQELGRTYDL